MIEQKFKDLANQYNADYNLDYQKIILPTGARLSVDVYRITIIYENIPVKIQYELGNSNTAEFNFELDISDNIPEFNLTTVEHFFRLFKRNKNPWSVRCTDDLLKGSLLKSLFDSGLENLAKKEAFEPSISGKYIAGVYTVKTVFNLGFNMKENSLFPVFEFQKAFISFLIKAYKTGN